MNDNTSRRTSLLHNASRKVARKMSKPKDGEPDTRFLDSQAGLLASDSSRVVDGGIGHNGGNGNTRFAWRGV